MMMQENSKSLSIQHPEKILFKEQKDLPSLASCEHYCGNEKFIKKAFALQGELGPIFDITCDCEDGARSGEEREHAVLVADLVNHADNEEKRAGVRIHDPSAPSCKTDIDTLIGIAGNNLAYITVPKTVSYDDAASTLEYIANRCVVAGIEPIPIHLIVEMQGAASDLKKIAQLPYLETLDFGLLDFVSDHFGAIPEAFMQSPDQFSHELINRAKTELAATALQCGIIPTHNPCVSYKDLGRCAEDARIARQNYGFLRMYSIHPKQIPFIVEAMQPSIDEVAKASEILIKAKNNNWGPISHANSMHDRASYRLYWHTLKRARSTGVNLPVDAQNAFFRDEPLIDWQAIKQFRR